MIGKEKLRLIKLLEIKRHLLLKGKWRKFAERSQREAG
jgi:hypothetical protein